MVKKDSVLLVKEVLSVVLAAAMLLAFQI